MPEAAERSDLRALLSSLALVALFGFWQPIGGVIWDVEGVGARRPCIAVYRLRLAAAALLHVPHQPFRPVRPAAGVAAAARQAVHAAAFQTPGLYRLVRHPLYVGWLLVFWATPTMTVAHLVFAVVTTAYILIAIQLEERDLVAAFGDTYVEYRRGTPMLIPRLWRR